MLAALDRCRHLILAVVLSGASTLCAASPPAPAFQQGNALYAAGNYAPAAAAYESAVRAGSYSANLFYDLGNTYARLGQRGRSILNYQRALLLDPAHAEARANLSYVRGAFNARTNDGSGWLGRKLDLVAIDLWTILAASAGWGRLATAAICLTACACAIGWIWRLDDGPKNAARAIVLTDRSRALYSPADNSKVITNLPAGSEVSVLSDQGPWVYAQLANGSRAWLAADNVEKVVPQPP
jgi:tetratricopeptide (TPR) repeat protein